MVDYSPYGLALFELASSEKEQLAWMNTLKELADIIHANREFRMVLSHPKITREKKKAIVLNVFDGKIDDTVLRFLLVLNEHDVLAHLEEIYLGYVACYKEAHDIEVVNVTSANTLSESQVERIQAMLEKKLNKQIELDLCVDPSLIAGVRVRGKDFIMDNSVVSRIAAIKEELNR